MPYRGTFGIAMTLHVLSAIFIVGPLGLATMAAPRLVMAGRDALPALRVAITATRVLSLGSVTTAGAGFTLLRQGSFGSVRSITDTWLLASLVLWVLAVATNLAVVVPALERAAGTIGDGGDGRRHLPAVTAAGWFSALCWVAVVVLMVTKPGT